MKLLFDQNLPHELPALWLIVQPVRSRSPRGFEVIAEDGKTERE